MCCLSLYIQRGFKKKVRVLKKRRLLVFFEIFGIYDLCYFDGNWDF